MQQCAVPDCAVVLEPNKNAMVHTVESALVPVCLKHMMHYKCLGSMLKNGREEPVCPLCRDNSLTLLKKLFIKHPLLAEYSDDDDVDEEYEQVFDGSSEEEGTADDMDESLSFVEKLSRYESNLASYKKELMFLTSVVKSQSRSLCYYVDEVVALRDTISDLQASSEEEDEDEVLTTFD